MIFQKGPVEHQRLAEFDAGMGRTFLQTKLDAWLNESPRDILGVLGSEHRIFIRYRLNGTEPRKYQVKVRLLKVKSDSKEGRIERAKLIEEHYGNPNLLSIICECVAGSHIVSFYKEKISKDDQVDLSDGSMSFPGMKENY